MKHLDILEKAKYIAFPVWDGNYLNTVPNHFVDDLMEQRFPSGKVHHLYYSNETYINSPKNEHHYTTNYNYKYVVPVILDLFGIKFDVNDYDKISYNLTYPESNKPDAVSDFSYLKPKKETRFYVYDRILNKGKEMNNLFRNWGDADMTYPDWSYSDYHNFLYCAHSCATIENLNLKHGPTLLISGDSQMILSIPILANYFSKITVLDLRVDVDISDLWKNSYFDYALIEYWSDNNLNDAVLRFERKLFGNFYLQPYF